MGSCEASVWGVVGFVFFGVVGLVCLELLDLCIWSYGTGLFAIVGLACRKL